jgi:hypothetical protein
MKVYVGHSSSINFEEEIYQPLKRSHLFDKHDFVLPHESGGLFDSKKFLLKEADLMVAEVSKASTGLGIELGWADLFEVPVICVYQEGSNPSGSLNAVARQIQVYSGQEELISLLEDELR